MKLCVEAGIGLGKTTLLRNLKKMNECNEVEEVEVVTEPVKSWRNVSGQDLLKLFAENPEKFFFSSPGPHLVHNEFSKRKEVSGKNCYL